MRTYTPRPWPPLAAGDRDRVFTLAESGTVFADRLFRDLEHGRIEPGEIKARVIQFKCGCLEAARILERHGARVKP